MLCINVFAIAIGNLAVGWAIDDFGARGMPMPITHILLATDVLGISSALLFAFAARASSRQHISGSTVKWVQ
ncbi:hypothetical protein LMG23994_00595 [Cupriavidus pinatubonensis]|nr:hypothetical protein LMG23994_00595 [Cupriavidus pinatubonensis]